MAMYIVCSPLYNTSGLFDRHTYRKPPHHHPVFINPAKITECVWFKQERFWSICKFEGCVQVIFQAAKLFTNPEVIALYTITVTGDVDGL